MKSMIDNRPSYLVVTRKLLLTFCTALLLPFAISAQTYFGIASTPVDNGTNTGTTATITPPALMAAGDLVVIYAQYRATGASLSISVTGGQTWNTAVNNNSASTQTVSVYWCRFNGTWAASPRITGPGALGLTAVMYVYRPSTANSYWEVDVNPTNSTSSSATNTITGITTVGQQTVAMAFWGVATNNDWSGPTGTNWIQPGATNQISNLGGSDLTHSAAYNISTSSGTLSDVAKTQTTSTSAQRTIMAWREVVTSNDLCLNDITITSSSTCNRTFGSLTGATYTIIPGIAASCGTALSQDVWYSFTAQTAYPTLTLANLGSSLSAAGARMYLYSGSCLGLTELACTNSGSINVRTSTPTINGGLGLTAGTTYYIRITKNNTTAPTGANWGFSICVTDPVSGDTFDFGKSFVNVSKGTNGGTVSVGDTLEIRATFVLRDPNWNSATTGTADSLAFYDTLKSNCGYRLLAGSNTITLKTNEGKIYKAFTNAAGDDAAHGIPNGADTVVRINFGLNASNTARGKLRNNTRPSVFGSTCIVMATYRVIVYAPYGSKIKWGGGQMTARDSITGLSRTYNFKTDTLIVYNSPGTCPNTVAATNAIGVESNGTFGSPTNPAPLARNRGTSTYVPGYVYAAFSGTNSSNAAGPGDYYYGIANNTSAVYSTNRAIAKADANNNRLFGVWDITGDHTNATDQLRGNPPCDTTLPISASNPCGYMLVVNSSYKTDTAFEYSLSGLCPNTYYELSAWVKNVCSRCSCDSTGTTPGTTGYIPTATDDSSGVRPNLAFAINGLDYYTTGDILHMGARTGIAPTRSDTANRWIKKGFVYKTGPTETSFNLTVRNNAPGGGGNDWALDDIAVAVCYPNMQYSHTPLANICENTILTITDTVRSYYDNYTEYKWQRWSAATSGPWTDIPGTTTSATPTFTGGAYQYVASYTIPPAYTTPANDGDLYRLVVATTSTNLGSASCYHSDPTTIEVNILIACGPPLKADLISFTGRLATNTANLTWVTTREDEPVSFTLDKSEDGVNYRTIAQISGYNNASVERNQYQYTDPVPLRDKTIYRITMTNAAGMRKVSRTVLLDPDDKDGFRFGTVVNPFSTEISCQVISSENGIVQIELINESGSVLKKHSQRIYTGTNSVQISSVSALPDGVYILRMSMNDKVLFKKVMKLAK